MRFFKLRDRQDVALCAARRCRSVNHDGTKNNSLKYVRSKICTAIKHNWCQRLALPGFIRWWNGKTRRQSAAWWPRSRILWRYSRNRFGKWVWVIAKSRQGKRVAAGKTGLRKRKSSANEFIELTASQGATSTRSAWPGMGMVWQDFNARHKGQFPLWLAHDARL